MTDLLQYVISGLALGAIYGLTALGFVVIYRASKVFNFAHGELLTAGAVLMVWLSSPPVVDPGGLGASVDGVGLPWFLALAIATASTGLIAAVIERVTLRPLLGRPVFVSIIVTLFVGFLLRVFVMLVFGNESMPIITPWDPMGAMTLAGAMLDHTSIAAIVAGTLAFAGFAALTRYSSLRAMMAVRDHDLAAAALGVSPAHAKLTAFGLSSFFAGIAGGMYACAHPVLTLEPFNLMMSVEYVAMVVLGGIGAMFGAVAGAVAYVLLQPTGEALASLLPFPDSFSSEHQSVLLFFPLLCLFLLLEPFGLLGVWLRLKRYFLAWPFRY